MAACKGTGGGDGLTDRGGRRDTGGLISARPRRRSEAATVCVTPADRGRPARPGYVGSVRTVRADVGRGHRGVQIGAPPLRRGQPAAATSAPLIDPPRDPSSSSHIRLIG